MWSSPKILQPSTKFLNPPLAILVPPHPQTTLTTTNSPSLPNLRQCCKLSRRRELAIGATSSFLLLFGCHNFSSSNARAEENAEITQRESKNDEDIITNKAFIEVSIGGEPVGKIVIGLYGKKAPAGAARFSDLVTGAAGISYKRKEFTKIMPNYVQHGGVRSYGVDSEFARRRTENGLNSDNLTEEWETAIKDNGGGVKNVAGSVGIIVRDPLKPPPKMKVVARQGKLEIAEEEVGSAPNGTEFVISVKDSPELDSSALVVGRVLEGMDVAERIGQVKTVKENTASPYFRVAKLIGDKRAVVAERGFNRPYSKVVVTNCGLIQ